MADGNYWDNAAFGTTSPAETAEKPLSMWDKLFGGAINSLATLPKRAIDASTQDVQHLGEPDYQRQSIGPAVETAMTMTGGAGVVPAEANSLRMGIKAYHGSPHDFDRFSMDKIGTGEGAQSYGHGLYFAENEGTAKSYRDALAKPNAGKMYQVDINADPAHFLDWDKPLNRQAPQIQESLKKAMGSNWDEFKYADAGTAVKQGFIASSPEATAAKLSVPGIKYLDQGSRGAGQGSSNFVVFNDKLIDIIKKYGLAGIAPPAAAMSYDALMRNNQ